MSTKGPSSSFQPFQAGDDSPEAFPQAGLRTCEVDADEAVCTVHRAGIDPDKFFAEQSGLNLVRRHAQDGRVDPCQIRGLQVGDREIGQRTPEAFRQKRVVVPDGLVQSVQPAGALRGISGFERNRPEGIHIAYLVMICTMKQILPIAVISTIIPMNIPEEEVKRIYDRYSDRHKYTIQYFLKQIRLVAGPILDHKDIIEESATDTEDLITMCTIYAGFSKLLAEKLLLLDGKDLSNGGSIEIRKR